MIWWINILSVFQKVHRQLVKSTLSVAESKPVEAFKWDNWNNSEAHSFVSRPQATIQLNQTAWRTADPCFLAPLVATIERRPAWLDEPEGPSFRSPKSNTLHNVPGRWGWSILISQATGEFSQCTFERLRDFLEYNASSCCQAFMVIRHSVEEWRISAAMELDELHVCLAAGGPEQPMPHDGPEPNLGTVGGAVHRLMWWLKFWYLVWKRQTYFLSITLVIVTLYFVKWNSILITLC